MEVDIPPQSAEANAKRSITLKGHVTSEDTKNKIKESVKKSWKFRK